jgi:hypothetical protein
MLLVAALLVVATAVAATRVPCLDGAVVTP